MNVVHLGELLKFCAIFFSGFFGSLGLLVDFKSGGVITKWGKVALAGIVISFSISATLQALEIREKNHQAVIETEKTSKMLFEIQKGVYNINPQQIVIEYGATIRCRTHFLERYASRVLKFIRDRKIHRFSNSFWVPRVDIKGNMLPPHNIVFTDGSPLYPDSVREHDAFILLGQGQLDIEAYKFGPQQSANALHRKPDLAFTTTSSSPEIEFNVVDSSFRLVVNKLGVDLPEFARRNNGQLQTLLDMGKARVETSLSDRIVDDIDSSEFEALRSYEIDYVSLCISGRIFWTSRLRKGDVLGTKYFVLPDSCTASKLNF